MNFNPARIELLIWDLDGTLVDSAADLASSVNYVIEQHGGTPLAEFRIRGMVGNGVAKLLDRALHAAGLDSHAIDSEDAWRQFSAHYETNCIATTACYAGVEQTLRTLQQRGYRHAICTNKPAGMAKTIVEHLHLQDLFGHITGGDSTEHRKPHRAPMLDCLAGMSATAQVALMIGDSAADVGVARAADIPVFVVPYGYTKTPAEELGADKVIKNASELLSILR